MTHYRAGADFERAVRTDLHLNGWWCIRAAGSKGKADLLAVRPGRVLVIQAKRDGKIGPAERTEVLRIAQMIIGGLPILAYKEPGSAAVLYEQLTGAGPKDRVAFYPDEVAA